MIKYTILILSIIAITSSATAQEEKKKTKVACIGDSITYGAGLENRKEECYPNQLQKLLGSKYEVKNFGVGGSTMLKTGKISFWNTKQYKSIFTLQPDVIVIKLGTNDANLDNGNWTGIEKYRKDYKEMVQAFQKMKSKPKIYLCSPAPAYPGGRGKREKVLESEIIPAINEIARDMKLSVIDLFKPLSRRRHLFPDKIHPNAEGHQIMAEEVYKAVSEKAYHLSGDWALPKNKEKLHIFFLMGQSNMSGYGIIKLEDRTPVPGVVQLPTIYKGELKWKPAAHPLNNRLTKSHRFGLGLPFAKQYLKDNTGVKVALIPCAWGGAAINGLKKGTDIYNDIIKKIAFAKKHGVIKGVLWHQGESDTVNPSVANSYEVKLHQLIKDIRADIKNPNLPFIVGNLAEFYGTGRAHKAPARVKMINQVKQALRDLPKKVKMTALVESTNLKSIDHHMVHFDRDSYIILGKRYAEAFKNLKKQSPPHLKAIQ